MNIKIKPICSKHTVFGISHKFEDQHYGKQAVTEFHLLTEYLSDCAVVLSTERRTARIGHASEGQLRSYLEKAFGFENVTVDSSIKGGALHVTLDKEQEAEELDADMFQKLREDCTSADYWQIAQKAAYSKGAYFSGNGVIHADMMGEDIMRAPRKRNS